MISHKFKFIFLILLFIFFLISCQGGKERTVFLAGGNAWTLFSEYVEYLKKQNIKYSVRNIKVQFFDGQQLRTITLDWRDWLAGESAMKMWERKLKKYEAVYNQAELNKVRSLGIDIFCVSDQETEIRIEGKKFDIQKQKPEGEKSNIQNSTGEKKGDCNPDAKRYVDLGVQFAMKKDYENAIKELKQAISISSGCAVAYGNLISIYILTKDYNLAIDTYKEGLKNAGDDGFLHYMGAIAHTYRKEYDYALNSIEKAIKLGFTNPEYYKKSDLHPLIQHKKKEFCKILNENKVVIKECL
jgi:tetratricopeptide (TPR) repeat protein